MSAEPNPTKDVTAARPNPYSVWVCGYQEIGAACSHGPTATGQCCQTVRANMTTAACSQTSCEGTCTGAAECEVAKLRGAAALPSHLELGPCIPRKSVWFTRQTIALNSAILVGGLLLLLMSLPQREAVFVPGELSNKHAQILGNTLVSDRCSLCHPNSHAESQGFASQDALCMKCHQEHMPDAVLRSPHDLNPEQLRAIEPNLSQAATRLVSISSAHHADSGPAIAKTSCAACHVEHHGKMRDIKAITDARCQACHQSQFTSFEHGHPQFDNYPYRTPRRIAFDHVAHMDKHFAQKNEGFVCSRCHISGTSKGAVGAVFRSVGFDVACASCHAEPIRSSTVNGWAVLQLPCIAPADAEDPSLGLSDWPAGAKFDYDGEVTLPMRLLLLSDPEASTFLERLPNSGKISDIVAEDRPKVTQTIARAFRRLVSDVANEGQAAWNRRLTKVAEQRLSRELNDSELKLVQETSAGLPPDLFREMEQHWFGTATQLAARPIVERFRLVSGGPQDGELLLGELTNELGVDELPAGDVEDDLLAGTDRTLLQNNENAEDLLGSSDSLGSDAPAGVSLDNDLLLGGDDNLLEQGLGGERSKKKQTLTKLRGVDHLTQGGWYLDKEILAVRYMPRGHADRTLAAWAEFASLLEAKPGMDGTDAGSSSTSRSWHGADYDVGKGVPGGCAECHLLGGRLTLDEQSSRSSDWASWRTTVRPESARLFTKFNHTPHLALPTVSDCRYCHVFEDRGEQSLQTRLNAKLQEPLHEQSRFTVAKFTASEYLRAEFVPMTTSQCVACHHQGSANDGCTQCHNYHVGSEGFSWSHTTKLP